MRKKIFYHILWIAALSGLLAGVAIFSLAIGSSGVSFRKLVPVLLEGRLTPEYSIIFDIRLPRIILAFAVGGSLSIAGVMLQGMFRNPLVEPYTLGISGGAALGVSAALILGLGRSMSVLSFPLSGMLGALAVMAAVYFLSLRKGMLKMQGLLLTGVMISFISSSLIMLVMAVSRVEDMHGIIFWIMGSLEEPNTALIKIAALTSLTAFFISYGFSVRLNALALGEDEAKTLGVNVEGTKKALFIMASLLTGLSVSIAGIIGFVGLVVPHFMRMVVGRDHRILLPASFLSGAAFLIFCDTLARTIAPPMELPVGVITGILGGMLFVYALNRKANIAEKGSC
ncbi:MAG: iron ABC transporter permease [Candidatus Omnitrophica bacterium]|nr:iron ABC transporter permease [Candidatus Omnitrophota bacterium]